MDTARVLVVVSAVVIFLIVATTHRKTLYLYLKFSFEKIYAHCMMQFREPGTYTFVNHQFAEMERGAMGKIKVTDK